jgi:hypothetical protein
MRRAFAWLLLALVPTGCQRDPNQPELPGLHPAVGSVNRSGQNVSGGVVQFTPDPDRPEFLINSEVGADGRFSLSTVRTTDSKGERHPGAPAGTYRVTYMPPVLDQTTGFVEPITLPKTVSIEAQDNDLKIELPAGATAR